MRKGVDVSGSLQQHKNEELSRMTVEWQIFLGQVLHAMKNKGDTLVDQTAVICDETVVKMTVLKAVIQEDVIISIEEIGPKKDNFGVIGVRFVNEIRQIIPFNKEKDAT
jgi:hypothetical protein